MKFIHSKSEIEELSTGQLEKLHARYVGVIFALLLIGGGVSLMAIWDYIPEIWSYLMLALIILLWPWVMRSSQMARMMKEKEKGKGKKSK